MPRGELEPHMSHPTGGAVDEHLAVRSRVRLVDEILPRCQRHKWKCRRFSERQRLGHRGEEARIARHMVGQGAEWRWRISPRTTVHRMANLEE